MSSRFADLLKDLQDEYEKQIQEVARLRSELSPRIPSDARRVTLKPENVKQEKRGNIPSIRPKSILDAKVKQVKKNITLFDVQSEWKKQFANFMHVHEDTDKYSVLLRQQLFYLVENYSSLYDNFFLVMLAVITVVSTLLLGFFWKLSTQEDTNSELNAAGEPDLDAFFYYFDMLQLVTTVNIDDSLRGAGKIVVYTCGIIIGMLVFAILIGIITEKFLGLIEIINEGKSKVPESNHTLLLGFNESTERVCCQIAFLRRKYLMNNSGFMQRWFRIGRIPPATPVAAGRIVILCNNKTKTEMHEIIERAFGERGISPKRTRVGWDVICRVGDPSNPQDLIMVGAHRAAAIAVMMNQQDLAEEEEGGIANAVTFRTVLALRTVLFAPEARPPWNNLRIIVPLSKPSKTIPTVSFEAPTDDDDGDEQVFRKVLMCQDLSVVLNTLMFTCCIQPGLGDVFMELMNFDGVALRLRKVKDFRKIKHPIVGKTFAQMSNHWKNAIVVGVISREFMDAEHIDPQNGFAPDGSRVIKESDRLLFISKESSPEEVDVQPTRCDIDYKSKVTIVEKRPKRSLLVCGFQQVWKNPDRFAFRISETCTALADGSHIYFLNLMPTDVFLAGMDEVCRSRDIDLQKDEGSSDSHRTVWMFENRITISFTEGDPANYDTLERVMKEQNGFDVSLVVPPPVDTTMSAQAQDTRLMTIMCALRAICENNMLDPIHVVGENKLESSAGLALRPKTTDESIDETDFVNVQAIIARAICQSMAFPFMQPAVVQLFSYIEGTPTIYIVQASLFVPVDYEIIFSDLIEEVKEECKDHICIGYRLTRPDQAKQILCPSLDERVSFKEQDSLVIISRYQPGTKPDASNGRAQSPLETLKEARRHENRPSGVLEPPTPTDLEPPTPLEEPFLLPRAINS